MDGLGTFTEQAGESPSSVANRIGVAPSTVTRPLKGERPANTDLALEVERATGGRLTAESFLSACLNAIRARRNIPKPEPKASEGTP